MKKITLIIGLIASGFFAHSQITITSTDIASPGTTVQVVDDTLSPAGINVGAASSTASSWSFTNLNFHGLTDLDFISPVGTPAAAQFPNSNLVMHEGLDYTYLSNTTNELTVLGALTNNLVQGQYGVADFDPDLTMIEYPLTYGDQFISEAGIDSTIEDTFSGIFDSLRLKVVIHSENEVDAFGSLETPSDTYPQTIRMYSEETQYDTIWGYIAVLNSWQIVSTSGDTTHSYVWLANNEGFFVMQMEADAVGGDVLNARYIGGGNVIAGVTAQSNPLCYGEASGSATIGATGGSTPYTFTWSDGGTGGSRNNLSAGTYMITVSEPGGTNDVVTLSLSDPDSLDIIEVLVTDETNGGDGAIDIDVSGGTVVGAYGYAWSNGEVSQDIVDLSAGDYYVTVSDDNQCTKVDTFTVGNNTSIDDLRSARVQIYPNPTQGLFVVRSDENMNKIRVMDLKGSIVYEAEVNNNVLEIDGSNWPSGAYFIHVSGATIERRYQLLKK